MAAQRPREIVGRQSDAHMRPVVQQLDASLRTLLSGKCQQPYRLRSISPGTNIGSWSISTNLQQTFGTTALRLFRSYLERDLGHIPQDRFWDVYRTLRSPRLRYVADDDIRRAFRHLSWVEFRDNDSMTRYFAFLEECLAEEIPLSPGEWNTAIAFAGRWVRSNTSREVRDAVEVWLRMERRGIQATEVTFNILFDVAVKAGRFALADTIFNELRARQMPLTRFFRTSRIYYYGMRGDGDGVRQAFRDLVNAGEIVDTAVMNSVILSLVRAGEAAAAENVFARMKRLVEQKLGTEAVRTWQKSKQLGVMLDRTAKHLRRQRKQHEQSFFGSPFSADSRKDEVQRVVPIAPNARTYRILLQHHCYVSGDWKRIHQLVAEMRTKGLHVHGSVYMHILRGFSQHGGYALFDWSAENLDKLWADFLLAASAPNIRSSSIAPDDIETDESETNRAPYFTAGLAKAAVRAFNKCTGKKKMLQVWDEIKDRWKDMPASDEETIQQVVDRFVKDDSMYVE
ncbi:hypothetical protein BAUCODRAFT_454234 [Baudoinia panamericana UAMH 10762]|uniref:Pentacotripeptide-repeat region of PRORP domain-containing protein n=1 Tax=Baudoinia panamericana (strain UAMH 10762) TaxID=717646 RepID=M2NEW0_BAUPA|nr:uncharacterized protein BAUCODRAFT_454234 [Baudoinia panamericana UAMH 10762]EMC97490.1 hypothetical protein BAUCODRAFT_454234 [Baudoinia panamericana UAMH 10762]